jgi:hypothetical protein
MMCSNIQAVLLYNIYIIYISDKSLSRFRSDFVLKKKYEVICIINFQTHIISGVYKGGALGALSREAKCKQDAKPPSIYSVRTEWVH